MTDTPGKVAATRATTPYDRHRTPANDAAKART